MRETVYNIKLPVFEGPFDLLLHLIREHEINIYDIPIVQVTNQYLAYLDLMKELNLDIAGEFLVMAATLTHIKSKMLLPKPPPGVSDDDGVDPREELTNKLVEYKGIKDVAGFFREQENLRDGIFPHQPDDSFSEGDEPLVDLDIFTLLGAFQSILKNIGNQDKYDVELGDISVTEKLNFIMDTLSRTFQMQFNEFFSGMKSKREVVATFLALLELVRLKLVHVRQMTHKEPMLISKAADTEGENEKDTSNH